MAEYLGSAQALSFINAAGTLNMGPETRQFTMTPNLTTVDATAGSDANRQHLPSFVDYQPSWQGVAQDGTSGTAYAQQLKAGVQGTLIWGPSGTVTGAVKYTVPAFSMGLVTDAPYADVVTMACDFGVLSGGSVTIGAY
jgi:hypothetical protein